MGHILLLLNHADIEITNIDNVKMYFTSVWVDLVLNTAAYNIVPKPKNF